MEYQMSSWPVTFNPRPLIWTTTYLSKHLFLRNHWAVILFRLLDQNGCNPHIWYNKICFIISCSWPWPVLELLRRSGERLRTFRSSSLNIYFSIITQLSTLFDLNIFDIFNSWHILTKYFTYVFVAYSRCVNINKI